LTAISSNAIIAKVSGEKAMAFDDRSTEPLIVILGLSVGCGLAIPILSRWIGGWSFVLFALPVGVWIVLLVMLWGDSRKE
jgi:hypothetical protein